MKKSIIVLLIIALSLILTGATIFLGALYMLKFDFSRFTTVKYETNTHEVGDSFESISVESNTSDIIFVPSEDGSVKVECYENTRLKHEVSVSNGTLSVKPRDDRKWYDHITIMDFSSPKITVYLPVGEYSSLSSKVSTGRTTVPKEFSFGDITLSASTGKIDLYASASGAVKISTDTGDIKVEAIKAGSLELSVTTGDISASDISCEGELSVKVSTGRSELKDISCKTLTSNGSTGKIYLEDVIVAEKLSIERSTGDVRFERCDAAELNIITDTGDVRGSLLSDKIFITKTDTGDVEVPGTLEGGVCEVKTDTGDIRISIN